MKQTLQKYLANYLAGHVSANDFASLLAMTACLMSDQSGSKTEIALQIHANWRHMESFYEVSIQPERIVITLDSPHQRKPLQAELAKYGYRDKP